MRSKDKIHEFVLMKNQHLVLSANVLTTEIDWIHSYNKCFCSQTNPLIKMVNTIIQYLLSQIDHSFVNEQICSEKKSIKIFRLALISALVCRLLQRHISIQHRISGSLERKFLRGAGVLVG